VVVKVDDPMFETQAVHYYYAVVAEADGPMFDTQVVHYKWAAEFPLCLLMSLSLTNRKNWLQEM
jgi:hypothetical protein